MGNISVSLPSDGTTADVADYNTPITTIVGSINGGLDNTNIADDAAIAGSKLANDSVSETKIDWSTFSPEYSTMSLTLSSTLTNADTYSVPETGKYMIVASFVLNNNGNTGRDFITVIRNGTGSALATSVWTAPNGSYLNTLSAVYIGTFNANDDIALAASANAASGVVLDSRSQYTVTRVG